MRHRITVFHPIGVIRTQHQLADACFMDQMFQVLGVVDQRVKIDLLQIVTGFFLLFAPATTVIGGMTMVGSPDIGRQEASAMRRDKF